ncbi:MAG TPA: hypothetical protein VGH49_00030, partial [Xanthobacteraceae bacterium]
GVPSAPWRGFSPPRLFGGCGAIRNYSALIQPKIRLAVNENTNYLSFGGVRAFSGKVDTGFPQKMRPNKRI